MNIPQDDLNQWARTSREISGRLSNVRTAVEECGNARAAESVEAARRLAVTLRRQMERAGAEPALEYVPMQLDAEETPLHLLDTPANRRYAALLRETVEALKAVERERGISDGASEILEDWLIETEEEIFGPAGIER